MQTRNCFNLPGYYVTEDGRVFTKNWNGKAGVHGELKPALRSGYYSVTVRENGQRATKYVHRLMLEAFVGPAMPEMHGCHNDGCRSNNHISNLRWDTRTGNFADKHKHGTFPTSNPRRIPRECRQFIRDMYAQGGITQQEIAKWWDVSTARICQIIRNAD